MAGKYHKIYPTFEAAQARVNTIKVQSGRWPGIVPVDGGWTLTFNPSDLAALPELG